MGQAKLRGSYEQRKAEGEEKQRLIELKRSEEARERKAKEKAWLDSLTPGQRKKHHKDRAAYMALLALSAGISFER